MMKWENQTHQRYLQVLLVPAAAMLALQGCGTTATLLSDQGLQVDTESSSSIFLSANAPRSKKISVDYQEADGPFAPEIQYLLEDRLTSDGHTVVYEISQAQYVVRINLAKIVQSDSPNNSTVQEEVRTGAMAGGAVGGLSTGTYGGSAAGVLIGMGAGMAGHALVENREFVAVLDVRIEEKTPSESSTSYAPYRTHHTRLTCRSKKINLTIEEAQVAMVEDIVDSVARILEP